MCASLRGSVTLHQMGKCDGAKGDSWCSEYIVYDVIKSEVMQSKLMKYDWNKEDMMVLIGMLMCDDAYNCMTCNTDENYLFLTTEVVLFLKKTNYALIRKAMH